MRAHYTPNQNCDVLQFFLAMAHPVGNLCLDNVPPKTLVRAGTSWTVEGCKAVRTEEQLGQQWTALKEGPTSMLAETILLERETGGDRRKSTWSDGVGMGGGVGGMSELFNKSTTYSRSHYSSVVYAAGFRVTHQQRSDSTTRHLAQESVWLIC